MSRNLMAKAVGCLAIFGCFLVLASTADAATPDPVADYEFSDTLASSVVTAPALTQVGSACTTPTYADETVNGSVDRVLTFPPGCGLQLDTTSLLSSPNNYSIVLLFRVSNASFSEFRRLFDPSPGLRGNDDGLYMYDGHLYYPQSGAYNEFNAVVPEQYAQLVLTRDGATDTVTVYLNGTQQFSFVDANSAKIDPSGLVRFLIDDSGGPSESFGGAVSRIRVYDTALTPDEVGALAGTPPGSIVLTRAGTGQGVVTSSPPGIDCGSDCSESYPFNSRVTLTATPALRTSFAGFSGGGCTGIATTCTVKVDQVQAVTATFTRDQRRLTITKAGSGEGTVTSSAARIDCGEFCSANFDSFTPVRLTATPAAGSSFAGFSGGGCGGTATTCTVTMEEARSVTATFTRDQRALTVTKAGSGQGRVTTIPAGIDCGATCAHDFDSGSQVFLVAAPAAGSRFAGFSGAGCVGTVTTCHVTMDQARSVTATFTARATSSSASGPGSGASPSGSGGDRTRPVVSGLGMFPARFAIGSLLPRLARAAKVATTIRFSLSERATVRLTFAQRRSGRMVGHSCRRATAALAGRPACTRYVRVSPSVTIGGARAGANRVRFQGRLSRARTLLPGRYRLTVVATDAAGNRSRPKRTLLSAIRRTR